MALTRTIYPERVLIVLNPDGSMKGAHQETLEVLAEDGVTIHTRHHAAAPLDAASLAGVLPNTAALLAASATAQTRIAELEKQLASLNA